MNHGVQLPIVALQRPSSLHRAAALLPRESGSYTKYLFPVKANWQEQWLEEESLWPLPSHYHCSSCHHKTLSTSRGWTLLPNAPGWQKAPEEDGESVLFRNPGLLWQPPLQPSQSPSPCLSLPALRTWHSPCVAAASPIPHIHSTFMPVIAASSANSRQEPFPP